MAAAALVAAAVRLSAQQVDVRLGGSHAHYADSLSTAAGVGGVSLSWNRPSTLGIVGANLAQFQVGGWSAQMSGSALVFDWSGPWAFGVLADGIATTFGGGDWSGTGTAGVFGSLVGSAWVASAGLGAGPLRRLDLTSDGVLSGWGRVSRSRGPLTLDVGVAGTRTSAERFADVSAAATVEVGRLRVGADASARVGDLGGPSAASLRAEWRFLPNAAVEAAAGRYLPTLTGFTAGRYVSAGVRFTPFARRAASARSPAASARSVVVERVAGGVRVTFLIEGADRPAIAGEWNGWRSVPLEPAGAGRWRAVLTLAPGTWRFSLVDGERWFVPPGVTALPDDFGGASGILVVPG